MTINELIIVLAPPTLQTLPSLSVQKPSYAYSRHDALFSILKHLSVARAAPRRDDWGETRTIWCRFFPCNAYRHNVKRQKILRGTALPPPPPRCRHPLSAANVGLFLYLRIPHYTLPLRHLMRNLQDIYTFFRPNIDNQHAFQ